jgi:two-component system cell cycle sensor histidine kinase/response regulator CckA
VQKMEAIGQLAGGIAHDFNNLMTAVVGYSAFVLKKMDVDDPRRLDIEEIRRAGERAAELTHQLLAFSRKQILQPRPLDLNAVVASLEMMLRRLIGGQANLVCDYGSDIGVVNADPGQLEQTIVNLVLNARDAMPHGGTVTISTGSMERYESSAEQLDVHPGQYVRLSVEDTGTGLEPQTQAHMFEPFFTTKRLGEGTGLGLSTVFGIVQQSGGHIGVESELGHGTTFHIYFPRVSAIALPVSRNPPPSSAPAGTETTLVVEDEDSVRSLIAGVLRELGYTVVEAKNGVEALELHARHPSPIAFMITDVVMPGLTGPALAQRLAPLAPQMKVLFISGYAADTLLRRGALEDGVAFLQKPFTPDVLAIKAREILDRTPHQT